MENILITGAGGFIGTALVCYLGSYNYQIFGVVRTSPCLAPVTTKYHESRIDDISGETVWTSCLQDINLVVHLAARVHVMHESSVDPFGEFRRVNVEGTKRLALQAAKSGVRRFIYISSVKVIGENTVNGVFSNDTPPFPADAYAISKFQSEEELRKISRETGMEVVIIRPPLVYGPNVGGNFLKLINLVNKGWPLPLASAINRRSLVSVYNLCDLIHVCLTNPDASNKTFLVSDDNDISIAELITLISEYLGKRANLFNLPSPLLRMIGKVSGRSAVINRLLDPLEVNIDYTKATLNWQPGVTFPDALYDTVKRWQDDRI